MDSLSLQVLGCNIRVRCEDDRARALLSVNYGHMQRDHETVDLSYTVSRQKGSSAFVIAKARQEPLIASDDSELLFIFEKDMTIELQMRRRNLYFVHSAVVEFAGKAFMLVAPSGNGKSTITWGLLHHDFRYLSDELGPIDLKTLEVHSYPHALCLKDKPPALYPLPEQTLYTSRTLHIPVGDLPSGVGGEPIPLGAVFFLQRRLGTSAPAVQPVSGAEASARLFANALNPLAHSGEGLDGAIEMTRKSSHFKLFTAELSATCALVKATVEKLSADTRHSALLS